MTRPEAAELFGLIAAAWPTVRLSPASAAVYTRSLEEFDYDVGRVAVGRVIDREDRWPSVKRLRDACREVRTERARDRAETRGLGEAPMTAEQLAENKRLALEMIARIGRPVEGDA